MFSFAQQSQPNQTNPLPNQSTSTNHSFAFPNPPLTQNTQPSPQTNHNSFNNANQSSQNPYQPQQPSLGSPINNSNLMKNYSIRPKQYDPSYEEISQMDLVNLLFFLKEGKQTLKDTHKKSLQEGFSLIFIPESIQELQRLKNTYTRFGQFKFGDTNQQDAVEKFWLAIINQFLKSHPYCSFNGIKQCLRVHIKMNISHYAIPNGQQYFFDDKSLPQCFLNNGSPDVNSLVFLHILDQIQKSLMSFCIILTKCYSLIPSRMASKFIDKQWMNRILNCFCGIYGPDLNLQGNKHHTFANLIFTSLLNIYELNLNILDNTFVTRVITFFDTNISIIHQGNQNSLSTSLRRKCLKFANDLLFSSPLQFQKWDTSIKKLITNLQSKELHPLKWSLPPKQAARQYFLISGSEWLSLFQIMSHQYQQNINSKDHSQAMYYLACSLICDNPSGFWSQNRQYTEIREYVRNMTEQLADKMDTSIDTDCLGKICRLLICSMGLNKPLNKEYPTANKSFSSVDFVERKSRQEQSQRTILLHTLYENFEHKISNGKMKPKQFFINILLKKVVFNTSFKLDQLFQQSRTQKIFCLGDSAKQNQYSYNFKEVCYQLVVKMLVQCPYLIENWTQLWAQSSRAEYFDQNDQFLEQSQSGNQQYYPEALKKLVPFQITSENLIYLLTFDYLLRVDIYRGRENLCQKNDHFQIFPHSLLLIDRFLQHKTTRNVCFNVLVIQNTIYNNQIKTMLTRALRHEKHVEAFSNHLQCLFGLGMFENDWVNLTCLESLQQCKQSWEINVMVYLANITRIFISEKYLKEEGTFKQMKNKMQGNNQFFIKRSQNLPEIPYLNQNIDQIMAFIKWSLRVQQNFDEQFTFCNLLYMQKKYEVLLSALRLLEVLAVLYIRHQDEVKLPKELTKFLAAFSGSGDRNLREQIGEVINLSNKRIITVPGALAFLVTSSTVYFDLGNAVLLETISVGINLMNLLFASCYEDLSGINMNVYESGTAKNSLGQQRVYCSGWNKFIDYLQKQIYSQENADSIISDEYSYRVSYHNGDILDILTLILSSNSFSSTFREEKVADFVSIRLGIVKGILLGANTISGYQNVVSFATSNRNKCTISDREVVALARYGLYLSEKFIHGATGSQERNAKMGRQIYELVGICITRIFQSNIDTSYISFKNQQLFIDIGIYICRIFRTMQQSLTIRASSRQSKEQIIHHYSKLLKNYLPYILHPFHLSINHPIYRTQYKTLFNLVLAGKQYLNVHEFHSIFCSDQAATALRRFITSAVNQIEFYMELVYALRVYVQGKKLLVIRGNVIGKQLKEIQNLVKQNIDKEVMWGCGSEQFRNKLAYYNQLSKNPSLISLLLFFKTAIASYSNHDHIFEELLLHNPSDLRVSAGINFKVLLLNTASLCSVRIGQVILMGMNIHHQLQFISISHFLYKKLLYTSCSKSDVLNIINYLQQILQQPMNLTHPKQSIHFIILSKTWASHLLNLILHKYHHVQIIKALSSILFHKTQLMHELGGLLQMYARNRKIIWPFTVLELSGLSLNNSMGLHQKSLLLGMIKLVSSLMVVSYQWASDYDDMYVKLCKAMVELSIVFSRNIQQCKNLVVNSVYESGQNMEISSLPAQKYKSMNSSHNEYEQCLERMHLYTIYEPTSYKNPTGRHNQNNNEEGISQMHPGCISTLDVIQEHFNLLILNRYVICLLCAYQHPQLCLKDYRYSNLCIIMENCVSRLTNIIRRKGQYLRVMKELDNKIWYGHRMSKQTGYINQIQQNLGDQYGILEQILQIGWQCLDNLKNCLYVHKDYSHLMQKCQYIYTMLCKYEKDKVRKVENVGSVSNGSSRLETIFA